MALASPRRERRRTRTRPATGGDHKARASKAAVAPPNATTAATTPARSANTATAPTTATAATAATASRPRRRSRPRRTATVARDGNGDRGHARPPPGVRGWGRPRPAAATFVCPGDDLGPGPGRRGRCLPRARSQPRRSRTARARPARPDAGRPRPWPRPPHPPRPRLLPGSRPLWPRRQDVLAPPLTKLWEEWSCLGRGTFHEVIPEARIGS